MFILLLVLITSFISSSLLAVALAHLLAQVM